MLPPTKIIFGAACVLALSMGACEGLCDKLLALDMECGDFTGTAADKSSLLAACKKAGKRVRDADPSFACAETANDCDGFNACKKEARVAGLVESVELALAAGNTDAAFEECVFLMGQSAAGAGRELCVQVAADHVAAKAAAGKGKGKGTGKGKAKGKGVREACELVWVRADPKGAQACDTGFRAVLERYSASDSYVALLADCRGVRLHANEEICAASIAAAAFDAIQRLSGMRDGVVTGERRYSLCRNLGKLARGTPDEAGARALCAEAKVGLDMTTTLALVAAELRKPKKGYPAQCARVMDGLGKLTNSVWAKSARERVVAACYLKLGAAVLMDDLPKMRRPCRFTSQRVIKGVARFKITDRRLDKLVAAAKAKGCK